jgi:hypothetical protein
MDVRQKIRASDHDRQEVVNLLRTTGHLVYPWPVWAAGPYGGALFAVSAGVTQIRRSRMFNAGPVAQ